MKTLAIAVALALMPAGVSAHAFPDHSEPRVGHAVDAPRSVRIWFDGAIDRHFSTCPSNLYPEPSGEPLPGQLRTGPHTDFGSLTILAVNDAPGGLQVLLPDGAWHDVRPAPGHFVVNLGDMMGRWTNDRWKSTVHRVVNPPREQATGSRRQTVGFFLHPNYDAEVACLPTCTDADHPPRYAPILAGEHMLAKLERREARVAV